MSIPPNFSKATIAIFFNLLVILTSAKAQNIQVFQREQLTRKSFPVQVTGTNVNFTGSGISSCPDKLHVTATNVTLQSGSGTITADSLNMEDQNHFTAFFNVPDYTTSYTISVDSKSNCSLSCINCVEAVAPALQVTPSTAKQADLIKIKLISNIHFQQVPSSDCPQHLQVIPENIVFKNSFTRFSAQDIFIDSAGRLTAGVAVPSDAHPGFYDVEILNKDDGACGITCRGCFSIPYGYTLKVSEDTIVREVPLKVTVSGNDVRFTQGTGTILCDEGSYDVFFRNVVFQQGSQVFYSDKITNNTGAQFDAEIKFPFSANPGKYDLVVGYGSNCPIVCNSCITLEAFPRIFKFSDQHFTLNGSKEGFAGQFSYFSAMGKDLQFSSESSACPGTLYVAPGEVLLKKDSIEFYPADVSTNGYGMPGNYFNVSMKIPVDIEPGLYDVIVGASSGCPAVCNKCFEIKPPQLVLTKAKASAGSVLGISYPGISFFTDQATICYSSFHAETNNIAIRNEKGIYYPKLMSVANSELRILLPDNLSPGVYDVISGYADPCPMSCKACLTIDSVILKPAIEGGMQQAVLGQSFNGKFSYDGLILSEKDITSCKGIYNPGNLVLIDTITKYHLDLVKSNFNDSALFADFDISSKVPTGKYHLVLGYGSGCEVISKGIVEVILPPVTVETSFIPHRNQLVSLTIKGSGQEFRQDQVTACPFLYKATSDLVTLRQGGTSMVSDRVDVDPDFKNQLQTYMKIPGNLPAGKYDVIVGEKSACPNVCHGCFVVDSTEMIPVVLNNSFVKIMPGNLFEGFITSNIDFSSGQSSGCPYSLQATSRNTFLVFRSDTIKVNVAPGPTPFGLTVSVHIPDDAPVGKYSLLVGSGTGCGLATSTMVEVYSNKIAIKSLSPDTGNVNQHLTVNISGQNFSFAAGSSTAVSVDPANITFKKDNYSFQPIRASAVYEYINVIVDVPLKAPLGVYDVLVRFNDSTIDCKDCFTLVNHPFIIAAGEGTREKITNLVVVTNGISFDKTELAQCPNVLDLSSVQFSLKKNGLALVADSFHIFNEQVVCDFKIPETFASGKYDIVLSDGGACPLTCKDCFQVLCDSFPPDFSGITGDQWICIDSTRVREYHVPMVAGVNYNWSVYGGVIQDTMDNRILVAWKKSEVAQVNLQPSSPCGMWKPLFKSITTYPARPEDTVAMEGNFAPCSNTNQVYKIQPYSFNQFSSFLFTKITGGQILQQSNFSLSVRFNPGEDAFISLYDSNACGLGPEKIYPIHVDSDTSMPVILQTDYENKFVSSSETGNQWYKNGEAIPGATGQNYLLNDYSTTDEYFVVVTDPCGTHLSKTSKNNIPILGIKTAQFNYKIQSLLLNVLPNPAESKIRVIMDADLYKSVRQAEVFDLYGERRMTIFFTDAESEIDLSGLDNGVYLFRFSYEGQVISRKVVVRR